MDIQDLTLDLVQEIDIKAAPALVFESMLKRLAGECTTPDTQAMPMVLEAWPGGRWFRDLGDQQGHLWGFVQVIKPPALLEITGPMFMSYAAAGHIQFRLAEHGDGTKLTMRHRVLGLIDPEHRKGVQHGWNHLMQGIKALAER